MPTDMASAWHLGKWTSVHRDRPPVKYFGSRDACSFFAPYPIFILEHIGKLLMQSFGKMRRGARPVGKLKK